MAEAVLLPRQGQSVETCIITQWFKNKGDRVDEGDILFSYETDKAAFDETATVSGILLEVLFKEGDEVPVLETVAVIGKEGEDISELISRQEAKLDEGTAATPTEAPHTSPETKGSTLSGLNNTGLKIRISPRARKMAEEKKLVLSSITGTGPNGRIIAADIELLSKTRSGVESGMGNIKSENTDFSGAFVDTPLSNIRKIISTNMLRSLQNSAQLTHHTSADARQILSLRKAIKNGSETRFPGSTTLNDMVCFAIVRALKTLPEMNMHFIGDHIRLFKGVHLGMAVDTSRGLMVPVLKNAERYNLGGLGESLKNLAENCKNGTIDPDLLASEAGTFTVSNLGAYGVEIFTPVLNIPQCGIMGINTIIQRPADMGDGSIGFIPHIGLSLTYDHRAIDGAPASRFLQEVSNNITHFSSII